jgi:hypothetical protein
VGHGTPNILEAALASPSPKDPLGGSERLLSAHDIPTPFPTTKGGHARNLHRRLAFGFCTGAASAPQARPVSVPARQRRDWASLPERRKGGRRLRSPSPPFFGLAAYFYYCDAASARGSHLREAFCVPRELVMRDLSNASMSLRNDRRSSYEVTTPRGQSSSMAMVPCWTSLCRRSLHHVNVWRLALCYL